MLFSKTVAAHKRVLSFVVFLFLCSLFSGAQAAVTVGLDKAPPSVIDGISANQPQEVIVLFDDSAIESDAASMRQQIVADIDTPDILAMKAARYGALKQTVQSALPSGEFEVLKDYSHLPMTFMRVNTQNAMAGLLERPEVVKVYENGVKFPLLASSLPFIHQPEVAAMGLTGAGTAVAVLDTGVNYLDAAFGTCSTTPPADCCPGGDCAALPPAAPSGCRVACVHDFALSDGQLDQNGHGTNVSGIVAGVAPSAKIIGLDVFLG